MSLYLLAGRFSQLTGLVVAILFGCMWVGSRVQLPVLSSMSQAFLNANGTPGDMLFASAIGTLIFVGMTIAFVFIGDVSNAAANGRDLRKSGWR